MFRCCFLAALGLLLSANALTAQTPNPAPAPAATEPSTQETMEDPQVGDHWTYEFRDNISGDVKSVLTNTVTDLTDSQIGISITRSVSLGLAIPAPAIRPSIAPGIWSKAASTDIHPMTAPAFNRH